MDPADVLVKGYSIELTRRSLRCLMQGECLHDDVINFALNKMHEFWTGRSPHLKVHLWATHFYVKLSEGGRYCYENVRRWMRRRGAGQITEYDKIVVPVHISNH